MGNQNLTGEEKAQNKNLELPIEKMQIRDPRELFKLKFPFYMMDIEAFEYNINQIFEN